MDGVEPAPRASQPAAMGLPPTELHESPAPNREGERAARAFNGARGALAASLAGLQGGMVGALWMLAWMGLCSALDHRSFWTAENLFATAFHRASAIRPGFSGGTVSGLALYLVLYSLLGAAFAAATRGRLPRWKTRLAAVLFGAVWYFASFHGLWKTLMPLAYLLHSEQPAFLGHLIYGTFLGRFPTYLEPPPAAAPQVVEAPPAAPSAAPSAVPATPVPTQSSSPPDPA